MQSYDYPYTAPRVVKRRVYREIFWHRIFIFIVVLSLTVGGTALYFFYPSAKRSVKFITVEKSTFYYVLSGSYETMQAALSASTALKAVGGAGYILNRADGFLVAAAVYKSRADADSVANRLNDGGVEAEVFVCESPTLKIEIKKNEIEATEFASLFLYINEVFDTVYRLSIELDEIKVTESYAVVSLSAVQEKLRGKSINLSAYSAYPESFSLSGLYSAVSALFSNALNYTEGTKAGSNLKYLLCGIGEEIGKCSNFITDNRIF